MELSYDLHIHSCLSPCGDDEMTPWNLVGMAKVLGLDAVALTDHNTARNLPQAVAAGQEYGVIVVPGMEISSKEDVHILGYFSSLEAALEAGEEVYAHLPDVRNEPTLFGNQLMIGEEDQVTGTLEKLLINATDLTVEAVCALVLRYDGVPVPAHINRGSNGMIGALGLMPFLPEHPVIEVSPDADCPAYATKGRFQLHSSDAHRLDALREPRFFIDTEEKSARGVFQSILHKFHGDSHEKSRNS